MIIFRKGQKSGSQAAALVGTIAALLVLYILFLPADERSELLGDEDENGYYYPGSMKNITVLNVTAVNLGYVGEDSYDHNIPNIYLFESTEGGILDEFTPFFVTNGWFETTSKELRFYIDDKENLDNVGLTFEAPKAEGRLFIYLNGVEIFDYSVSQLNVGPVELKKDLLKEGDNYLSFEVSGVGIRFWAVNEYSIEDIIITADFKDVSRQESETVFTVTDNEYDNIDKARLEFFPICVESDIGKLDVMINRRSVFSSVPECESLNRIDIFEDDIKPGRNTVSFATSKGSYRVEMISIKTTLKETKSFLRYFEVNSSVFEDIQDKKRDVFLEIEFVDDREDKEADININKHLTNIDQREYTYSKKITEWVEEGARNYIEITPKSALKIVEMRIVVSKR